jgi:hypothetical protein
MIMTIFSAIRVSVTGLLMGLALVVIAPASLAADVVAKTYPIKDFTEVYLGGNAILEISQDGTEYLRVEATPELMERVIVDLTGKRLTLSLKHKEGLFNWFSANNHDPVRFILRVKQLTFVELSGAARGRFSDFQGNQLRLHASGAANAEFAALNVEQFAAQLSGASNLRIDSVNSTRQDFDLSGASNLEVKQDSRVQELRAGLSGASNMRARALKARVADLGASGASHIEASVMDSLDARASGASSIEYYGRPGVRSDSSGASHIKARGD